jgi:hypothetical protein
MGRRGVSADDEGVSGKVTSYVAEDEDRNRSTRQKKRRGPTEIDQRG